MDLNPSLPEFDFDFIDLEAANPAFCTLEDSTVVILESYY
jgi:hypothetical protein